MIETLIDFCGRGVVVFPTKADLDHPELGPELRLALRGHNISAEDRTKIFRYIHERFLTEWGARHAMFEKFNGTPLWVIKLLTMQRVEYQVDGPLTQLARDGRRPRRRLAAGAANGRGEGSTTRRSASGRRTWHVRTSRGRPRRKRRSPVRTAEDPGTTGRRLQARPVTSTRCDSSRSSTAARPLRATRARSRQYSRSCSRYIWIFSAAGEPEPWMISVYQ